MRFRIEWPTVGLIALAYGLWMMMAIGPGQDLSPILWVAVTGVVSTLFWSITHEVCHGHPTSSKFVNGALIFLPICWTFPYGRFRDTHLEHHATGELTDPFEDPESAYLFTDRWKAIPSPLRLILTFNNTLAGRLLIGPIVATIRFYLSEIDRLITEPATRARIVRDWLLHLVGIALLVAILVNYSAVPVWQFAAAAYMSISLLLIRTFVEHQAEIEQDHATVVIESKGPLAFLFLFNNLHAAHHLRPGLPWYRLPGFYRRHREAILRRNGGYFFPSYWAVIWRYFLRPKEPVPHPLRDRPIGRKSTV